MNDVAPLVAKALTLMEERDGTAVDLDARIDAALAELAAATSVAEAARLVGLSRQNTSGRVWRHLRRVGTGTAG